MKPERILHGGLVRPFDLRGDVRVGDRPQRRHRLDRGEGQVIAGDRLGARTRLLRDGGGDLAGIDRSRPCSAAEELPRHLGPDLARSAGETGQSAGSPACSLNAAIRFATSTRNGLARRRRP